MPLPRKTTDQRINEAIEGGQRNQATFQLVHNWCRHARIERHGGVGMVEAATALPIGMIGMACDHAPAGGLFSWDLADAAINFHDRNCVHCKHRIAVGFPNIATLVGERDARRQRAEAEQLAQRNEFLARREARRAVRQQLRVQLPSLSRGILDDLEELDQDAPGNDVALRLVATAKLAPETFTPELIEHLFEALESEERWLADCGLRVLQELKVDLMRLATCAMRFLRTHNAVTTAAEFVERHAALIEPSEISEVLPALADLAAPERLPLQHQRESQPGPLRAVHAAHRDALEAAIERLMSERDPLHVSLAAGATEVLSRTHRSILRRFARSLAAKLNGAEHLIDKRQTGYSGDDESITRLQLALTLALRYAPEETDTLLGQFLAGAGSESEVRLYKVYALALDGHRRRSRARHTRAAPIALRRLLGGLKSQNQDALQEIQSALSHCAEEHVVLARREFNALLGSALVLDEEVKRFDAHPPEHQNFFDTLERRNRRGTWTDLRELLLEWAATAARGSPAHISAYLEVLNTIPEEQAELRSAFIARAKHFMGSPEGLNAMLPTLYTAMVGSSIQVRSTAAKVLGQLNERTQEDLPELVHEAFAVLLADPYVWVHQAAVKALRNLKLPDAIDQRAHAALRRWILNYAASPKEGDRFLVECLHLYSRRYASPGEQRTLAAMYVKALERMKPYEAISELRGLRHELAEFEGFAAVVIRLLSDAQLSEHQVEDVLDTLAALSPQVIQDHRMRLVEIASTDRMRPFVVARIAEILTGAGAWQEAARVTETAYGHIPETTQHRVFKLTVNLWRIATRFEEVLSQGQLEEVTELASQWRVTEAQIEADRVKYAQQRNLIPGVPLSD
jgi:hypothetical protein